MAMKPDIHAGSGMANAIVHNANATAHTMLASSQMLGNNLSNIFETMNRNRALREQEEQRKLDNAYRENVFNEQKAANERNYNFEREKYNNALNQWNQEMGLKRQQIAQGWGHANLYKQQAEALRFQNERNRQLYSDDIQMFDAPTPPPTPPSQPSEFLTKEEVQQRQTQQQQAPQSYLSAVWEINQRKAQVPSSNTPMQDNFFSAVWNQANAQAQTPQAHQQAPQQPNWLAQQAQSARQTIGNAVPKMAVVMNQRPKPQSSQPQIVMRSDNQNSNGDADFNQKMAEADKMISQMQQKLNSLEAK